ncbi:NAD(P)H-dependent oxidoreductase [Xanthomonas sp. MUS 060]|uniref:FMN-dependent NADH-azoreductase n=1 Tax=Xanthomonas sp. MUS 060 TaxID=1588031 RepID=UPI000AF55CFA|nr:NAD(P)H-dependent oxidoreductase [Xanthomonas sp. MUS 060]
MSKVLLITSSPRGADSLSTRFATEIANGIRAQQGGSLTVRDLVANPAPHITVAYIQGRATASNARTPEQIEAVEGAQELVDELRAADVIVLGSGMMNFGPSSQLKAWIDHVTWPGITFSYGTDASQGLLTGKKVYLVTAAGGVFSGSLCTLRFPDQLSPAHARLYRIDRRRACAYRRHIARPGRGPGRHREGRRDGEVLVGEGGVKS